MAEEGENLPSHNPGEKIKSVNADLQAFVIFYNRTSRRVNLLWCNYSGQEVLYILLKAKQDHSEVTGEETNSCLSTYTAYCVNTFVSHPWIARDASTGALLRMNQNKYFLPVAFDGEEHRAPVFIDIPVFSLKDRCLEVIRRLMDVDLLSPDEIPPTLISSLKQNRVDSFITYEDYISQNDDNG